MTKYLKSEPFSVALGSKAYRDNWDAVFGKKDDVGKGEKCPTCNGTGWRIDFSNNHFGCYECEGTGRIIPRNT